MTMTSNFGKRKKETVQSSVLIEQIAILLTDLDSDKLAKVAEFVMDKEVKVTGDDTFTITDYLEVTITTRK